MPIRMAPSRLSATSSARLVQPETTRSGKQVADFYRSPEWKTFRNQLIKERGWRCEDPKCETPRGPWKQIYGHHVVEISDGGARLDRANIRLCCGVCHGRVTQENKLKRAGWIDIVASS
jgi:hypothetical protein